MMPDVHAHYTDPAFDADRDSALAEALESCSYIINAGWDVPSSAAALALAAEHDNVYAAVGIHPQYHGSSDDIAAMAGKAAAIGETGLDYRRTDMEERQRQRDMFERHIEIAKEYNLPIVIHCVDAWGDMLGILRHYRPRCVLHGFSGSAETAREAAGLGAYISFGGRATYPAAKKAHRAIAAVPRDRLLLETDAPYSPPVPYSGRCVGNMLAATAEFAAGIIGITAAQLEDIVSVNASALFEINI